MYRREENIYALFIKKTGTEHNTATSWDPSDDHVFIPAVYHVLVISKIKFRYPAWDVGASEEMDVQQLPGSCEDG